MEQRSSEWFATRCGKVTASRVADILATTKTGVSASRQNYLIELAIQRVTGVVEQSYTNAAMQHGIAFEGQARAAYEVATNTFVDQIAFVDHPTIAWYGASPDGLINTDGMCEIKCMQPKGHWEVIKSNEIPKNYWIQQQVQLSVTGRDWNDYVGFSPVMPERSKLFIKRTFRDDKFIAEMEDKVKQFLEEVSVEVQLMENM